MKVWWTAVIRVGGREGGGGVKEREKDMAERERDSGRKNE